MCVYMCMQGVRLKLKEKKKSSTDTVYISDTPATPFFRNPLELTNNYFLMF